MCGSQRCFETCDSSMARNREGTSTIRVTRCRAKTWINFSRFWFSALGRTTVGTPLSNGPKISHTASTKLNEDFAQQTSLLSNGNFSYIHMSRLMVDLCKPITPLGLPVEPDV